VVSRRGQLFFVVSQSSNWSSWSVVFSRSVSRLDRRGQSSWSVVLRGQSAFFLVVVVSFLRDQSFFVVSRLGRRGQSLWSVVLRGWCLYSMVVMHTYLLRHIAGEYRGQCLDKCTVEVGRIRVGCQSVSTLGVFCSFFLELLCVSLRVLPRRLRIV